MAEDVVTSAAPAAPAAPAAAVADIVAAVAPVVAPAAPAEPAAVVAPVAPAAEPAKETPAAPAADPAKPAEAAADPAAEPAAVVEPKVGEPKPEGAAAEGVAEPVAPKPHEFKLPENVKADPAVMTAYGNVLSKYGISPEAGQELIDFHANTIKAASEQMAQQQQDYWAQTQKDWVADFDKSAGNRRDTILNDAKFAISDTIKDAKERQAVWDVLALTGAGNNKSVINALAKIGKRLREPTGEKPGTPVVAKSGTPAERRYGAKT